MTYVDALDKLAAFAYPDTGELYLSYRFLLDDLIAPSQAQVLYMAGWRIVAVRQCLLGTGHQFYSIHTELPIPHDDRILLHMLEDHVKP